MDSIEKQYLDEIDQHPEGLDRTLPRIPEKRKSWVRHYLITGNATEATRLAGYSRKTVENATENILNDERVQAHIEFHRAHIAARANIRHEEVIQELKRVAFMDPGQVFDLEDKSLSVRPMKDWPAEARRAMSGVTFKKEGPSLKFHDKIAALKQLAEISGLNRDPEKQGFTLIINSTPEDKSKPRERVIESDVLRIDGPKD